MDMAIIKIIGIYIHDHTELQHIVGFSNLYCPLMVASSILEYMLYKKKMRNTTEETTEHERQKSAGKFVTVAKIAAIGILCVIYLIYIANQYDQIIYHSRYLESMYSGKKIDYVN